MKNTLFKKMRQGSVILWAMVTLAVVTTVLGAVGTYHVTAMRAGQEYLAANREYYSFLYAKGQFETKVNEALATANEVAQEQSLGVLVDKLKKLQKMEYWDGDNHVVVTVQGLDTLESDLENNSEGTLTIVAAVYRKGPGGVEILAKQFEKDIKLSFGYDSTSGQVLHPIFNYVYFANNRGHLESPYSSRIIVNGDIGSNDRFTINGATVNGYVRAHTEKEGENAVDLMGPPHIWPYPVYLNRVVSEYLIEGKEYFTQVRPTDPILHKSELIPWSGGYQAPGEHNGTIAIDDSGKLSFVYPKEGEKPDVLNITVSPDPGEQPKADPMPLPTQQDSNYWDTTGIIIIRKEFNSSKYVEYLYKWLTKHKYSKIKKKDIPTKGWKDDVSKYESNIKSWASKNGINTAGKADPTAVAAWELAYFNHTNDEARVAQNAADIAAWQKEKDEYISSKQVTLKGDGDTLTRQTVHRDPFTGVETNIINSTTEIMPMPNVSDAEQYRSRCRNFTNEHGHASLVCENRYQIKTGGESYNIVWGRTVYDKALVKKAQGLGSNIPVGTLLATETNAEDTVTFSRSLAKISIQGGYVKEVYPFEARDANGANQGLGSDPYYAGTEGAMLKKAECGSVILIGTSTHPIRISGPTYIDGDVVIRGFVTGQGTIYAGRNVHIIGDITYLNPPHWPHSTASMDKSTPEEVRKANLKKDSLTLVARGNIIVGNYTDSSWKTACQDWLKKGRTDSTYRSSVPCCNDYADDAIGYAGFARDYTDLEAIAEDENEKITLEYAQTPYDSSKENRTFLKLSLLPLACNIEKYHMMLTRSTRKRRFYECKLGGEVICDLMQQASSVSVSKMPWNLPSSGILAYIFRTFMGGSLPISEVNYETISYNVTDATGAIPEDAKAGDITQIDAILFANHGIFGKVGGTYSYKFKLHGAMLCRDEGLLPSFAEQFKNKSGAEAWVNWDMRIKSDSAEGIVGTGGPADSVRHLEIQAETSWRQTK